MKFIKKHQKRNVISDTMRYLLLHYLFFLILLAGILLDEFWVQGIGTIILIITFISLFLFFKRKYGG